MSSQALACIAAQVAVTRNWCSITRRCKQECEQQRPAAASRGTRAHHFLHPVAQQVAGGRVALHAQQRRVRLARHLAQLRVGRVLRHLRAAAGPQERAAAGPQERPRACLAH